MRFLTSPIRVVLYVLLPIFSLLVAVAAVHAILIPNYGYEVGSLKPLAYVIVGILLLFAIWVCYLFVSLEPLVALLAIIIVLVSIATLLAVLHGWYLLDDGSLRDSIELSWLDPLLNLDLVRVAFSTEFLISYARLKLEEVGLNPALLFAWEKALLASQTTPDGVDEVIEGFLASRESLHGIIHSYLSTASWWCSESLGWQAISLFYKTAVCAKFVIRVFTFLFLA